MNVTTSFTNIDVWAGDPLTEPRSLISERRSFLAQGRRRVLTGPETTFTLILEDFRVKLALIEKAWQEHDDTNARSPAGWVGPDHVDEIASVLIASGYLNEIAKRLYDTSS